MCISSVNRSMQQDYRQFYKDYCSTAKLCQCDDYPNEITKSSTIDELRSLTEKEFVACYGEFPTCAVFAPGSLALGGSLASKSYSMAIQLVTLVVGKLNHDKNWCHIKTLSDEINEQKSFLCRVTEESLEVEKEDTSWIRLVKQTLKTFKRKAGHVPGFKILISSNLPVKRALGSSSALVVAIYTFLEAITNSYTSSILEKTMVCHLAEKRALGNPELSIEGVLASTIGQDDKVFSFDARSLQILEHDWISTNVVLLLVQIDSKMSAVPQRHKRPLNILNVELMDPREVLKRYERNLEKDEMKSRLGSVIQAGLWKELGELLWESYHSTRKCLNFPDDIERIISVLETIEEVHGAKVISCGYGASIVVLVQRRGLKSLIYTLEHIKKSRHRYYIAKPSMGATVLYTYENLHLLSDRRRRRNDRSRVINLVGMPLISVSVFMPISTVFD